MNPEFPRLTESNHRITSPATSDYNCVAWSAGDTAHWWQPGVYWPISATRDDAGIDALQAAFSSLGYDSCADGARELGYEKLALYATTTFYTHAARQLSS